MDENNELGHDQGFERKGDLYILKGGLEDVKREQAEQKKREEKRREQEVTNQNQQVSLNRRLVALTFALVVLGVGGTGISVWQSLIAQRAATAAMNAANTAGDALKETQRATGAAITAANAAENQLPIQRGQLELVREQTKLAARDIDQAREALRLESRAWVTLKTVKMPLGLKPGEVVYVELREANSGQSPALKVRHTEADSGMTSPCAATHQHRPTAMTVSESVIAPGAEYGMGYFANPLSAAEIANLYEEKAFLFFWGTFQYEDAFKRQHLTRYCFQWAQSFVAIPDRPAPPLGWCGCHNEAS